MNPVNQGFPETQVGHFSEICRTLPLDVFVMCRRLRSDFYCSWWYTSAKFVVHLSDFCGTLPLPHYHTSNKFVPHFRCTKNNHSYMITSNYIFYKFIKSRKLGWQGTSFLQIIATKCGIGYFFYRDVMKQIFLAI